MKNREVPRGLRDFLPEEVKNKRFIEDKARQLFQSFSYEEVITPTFEYLDVAQNGTSGKSLKELFLMIDRDGEIISLRPEVTASIARMAATHLQEKEGSCRLFYISNVFRQVEPKIAQYREFWQAGVELLGTDSRWADAEVISLAVKLMQELGLNDFKLSLNQIAICNSLLDEVSISQEEREKIRKLVERKDLVELSQVLEQMPIDEGLKETIHSLPLLHGGPEIIKKIPYIEKNQAAFLAMQELLDLYETTKVFGVQDHIVLDMGVLRGLDYYTGVVFEGYSADLGYGLLGGGRYDKLLKQFGYDCPATGFALGIDRLALLLDGIKEESKKYLIAGQDLKAMVSKADELRKNGFVVEMDLTFASKKDLEAKIKKLSNIELLYFDTKEG